MNQLTAWVCFVMLSDVKLRDSRCFSNIIEPVLFWFQRVCKAELKSRNTFAVWSRIRQKVRRIIDMSNELYVFLNTNVICTWKKQSTSIFKLKLSLLHTCFYTKTSVLLCLLKDVNCFGLKVVGISIKYIQCKQIWLWIFLLSLALIV